jgi:APA family basic amino acid/polyamine antiporter
LSLFLGTLIVSVIYILANIMYLAVVPLYDIATAESDRVAVVASQVFLVRWNINYRGDDYDFDFACNNGLIMARVYYTMAQDGVFFKAAELNHAVFQLGLSGRSVSGLRLCV